LDEAKSFSELVNKDEMYNNDVQVPIQNAKDGTIPRLSPRVVNTYYILIFNLKGFGT